MVSTEILLRIFFIHQQDFLGMLQRMMKTMRLLPIVSLKVDIWNMTASVSIPMD